MFEELEEIRKECEDCQKCALGKTRTKLVFSAGTPNNKIVLIGEAPGYNEDQTGEPFVGRAGQLLDKILESVGLSRKENVYLCNTIKCRPPNNRDPLPAEKTACRAYLDRPQNPGRRPHPLPLCRTAQRQTLPLGAAGPLGGPVGECDPAVSVRTEDGHFPSVQGGGSPSPPASALPGPRPAVPGRVLLEPCDLSPRGHLQVLPLTQHRPLPAVTAQ